MRVLGGKPSTTVVARLLCVPKPSTRPDPYADLMESYLEEVTKFLPDNPTYLMEMTHWHKTAKPRVKDLALKGRLHKPCECGKPYFANGKCRPCYFREYNRTHVRNHNRKAA